jgi:hypothetical protein
VYYTSDDKVGIRGSTSSTGSVEAGDIGHGKPLKQGHDRPIDASTSSWIC